MYIIYGQKTKNESVDNYPLNSQIKFLSHLFDNRCWIFSMPGYLSKGRNAEKYINDFNNLVSESDNTQYIGFGNGYNAGTQRVKYINSISQQSINNPDFRLRNYSLDLPANGLNNHSKALFYFSWKREDNLMKEELENGKLSLSRSNMDCFLNAVSVNAVIVGSSNQSFLAYFSQTADKGETDVLLIKSDMSLNSTPNTIKGVIMDIAFNNGVEIREDIIVKDYEYFFDNNIIAKSILSPQKYETDEKFLNDIFRECLENELADI